MFSDILVSQNIHHYLKKVKFVNYIENSMETFKTGMIAVGMGIITGLIGTLFHNGFLVFCLDILAVGALFLFYFNKKVTLIDMPQIAEKLANFIIAIKESDVLINVGYVLYFEKQKKFLVVSVLVKNDIVQVNVAGEAGIEVKDITPLLSLNTKVNDSFPNIAINGESVLVKPLGSTAMGKIAEYNQIQLQLMQIQKETVNQQIVLLTSEDEHLNKLLSTIDTNKLSNVDIVALNELIAMYDQQENMETQLLMFEELKRVCELIKNDQKVEDKVKSNIRYFETKFSQGISHA